MKALIATAILALSSVSAFAQTAPTFVFKKPLQSAKTMNDLTTCDAKTCPPLEALRDALQAAKNANKPPEAPTNWAVEAQTLRTQMAWLAKAVVQRDVETMALNGRLAPGQLLAVGAPSDLGTPNDKYSKAGTGQGLGALTYSGYTAIRNAQNTWIGASISSITSQVSVEIAGPEACAAVNALNDASFVCADGYAWFEGSYSNFVYRQGSATETGFRSQLGMFPSS